MKIHMNASLPHQGFLLNLTGGLRVFRAAACCLLIFFSQPICQAQSLYTLGDTYGHVFASGSTYYYASPYPEVGTPAVSYADTQQLTESPFISQSLSVSVNPDYHSVASASISYQTLADQIKFEAMTNAEHFGITHEYSSIAYSSLRMDLEFSLATTTTVEVQLTPYDRPGWSDFYSIIGLWDGSAYLHLQKWNGSTWDSFYNAAGTPWQFDGYNPGSVDGIFYSGQVSAGLYRLNITSDAVQGSGIVEGSLNFKPVPEPSSALLMLAAGGVLLIGRRRRAWNRVSI